MSTRLEIASRILCELIAKGESNTGTESLVDLALRKADELIAHDRATTPVCADPGSNGLAVEY
jgi:hypothetical protein